MIQNNQKTNYSLRDLLDLVKREMMLALNCHGIATVQTFNPVTQTLTATLNYVSTLQRPNSAGQSTNNPLKYPVLVDCPAIILGGGTCSLTFPIKTGDECLIIFNDRDMDNWFASGPGLQVNTQRLHSFSDAIALVGLRSKSNALPNYDMVRSVLRNGVAAIGVNSTKILLTNNYPTSTNTLNTQMQALLTELQALTASLIAAFGAISVGNNPAPVAAITTIQTNLASTATAIGGLLE